MPDATILAVDDDPLMLRMLKDELEDAGFEVIPAENGRKALDILAATPDRFDAIVLDRVMPEMNGMEVLAAIRNNKATSGIPVIFQTVAASQEEMKEGIEAGAFFYIAKPYEPSTLVAIVRAAVQAMAQRVSLTAYDFGLLADRLSLLEKGRFVLRTVKDARSVAWMISQQAQDTVEVSIGLEGIITNAIEHGNLGLGGATKEVLIRQNAWEAEIDRRLLLPENMGKTVVVDFEVMEDEVVVRIEDQGNGFDWQAAISDGQNLINKVQGRGILFAMTSAFTSLTYENGGRCAVVSFDSCPLLLSNLS